MKYKVEICSNSVQSALNAEAAGAHRVELCDNLWESGTTPSYATLKIARAKLLIELFVLIRPRGGDFYYSDLEFETIKEDIRIAKELGADGIVSGVLNINSTIDVERTKQLIDLSYPLPFTFHRAFDITPSLSSSLEELIACGAIRVLTSGGHNSAMEGSHSLTELNQKSAGRIIILPGGGINSNNIEGLLPTGCMEFHLTGSELTKSPVEVNSNLRLNGSNDIPENDYKLSSINKVREVVRKLS